MGEGVLSCHINNRYSLGLPSPRALLRGESSLELPSPGALLRGESSLELPSPGALLRRESSLELPSPGALLRRESSLELPSPGALLRGERGRGEGLLNKMSTLMKKNKPPEMASATITALSHDGRGIAILPD